jgi:hypothetical protein
MATKILTPILLAGAAATAILFAPSAGATTSASCDDNGVASVCTRSGHAAIVATPNVRQQGLTFAPGGNLFGAGPTPPLLAMD